jgi:hypothetical protein
MLRLVPFQLARDACLKAAAHHAVLRDSVPSAHTRIGLRLQIVAREDDRLDDDLFASCVTIVGPQPLPMSPRIAAPPPVAGEDGGSTVSGPKVLAPASAPAASHPAAVIATGHRSDHRRDSFNAVGFDTGHARSARSAASDRHPR